MLPQEAGFKLVEAMWDRIREETDGRIDVTAYAEGALVPFDEILNSVREGVIEAGYTTPGYYMDFAPSFAIGYGMPGFFMDFYDMYNVHFIYGLGDVWREDLLDKTNGEILMWPKIWDDAMLLSTKPIRGMADFEGLKIRSIGLSADWFNKMGAATTYLPASEIYTSFNSGLLDAGYYASYSAEADLKLNEVCDYYITPAFGSGIACAHFISTEAFNSLPPDLQLYLDGAILKDFALYNKPYFDENNRAKHEVWAKECTELNLPQEEIDKMNVLAWEVLDEYVADSGDPACEKAFGILKQYLKDRKEWTGR